MIKILREGYTFIEMLIAIVIIATILGISTPVFYRLARNLPAEAKLTSLSQKLFFLLSDARREGFNSNSVVCIKYDTKAFFAFIDNDFNRLPDDGKYISSFEFKDKEYEGVIFKFNGAQVTSIQDLYTIDGIFTKHISDFIFDLTYSNCTFEFSYGDKSVQIEINNSYPKIIEK
ncbi:pilus assembly FimT family protein [Fervidobacterium sp.]